MEVEAPLMSPLLEQITVHAGEVTKIVLSPDSKYLFSVGTDGSLFIFSVGEQHIQFDKFGQLIAASNSLAHESDARSIDDS